MFERLRLRRTKVADRGSFPIDQPAEFFTSLGERLISASQVESILRSVGQLQTSGSVLVPERNQGPPGWRTRWHAWTGDDDRSQYLVRATLKRLQTVMRRYGRELRLGGVRPEHLVPPVRRAMQEAAAMAGVERMVARDFVQLGVLWGIEGYYGTT